MRLNDRITRLETAATKAEPSDALTVTPADMVRIANAVDGSEGAALRGLLERDKTEEVSRRFVEWAQREENRRANQ